MKLNEDYTWFNFRGGKAHVRFSHKSKFVVLIFEAFPDKGMFWFIIYFFYIIEISLFFNTNSRTLQAQKNEIRINISLKNIKDSLLSSCIN